MRGDSEIRFLNLKKNGCKESLLPPAEAICQFLSSNLLSETTHLLSFLLPLKLLMLKEKQTLILQKLPT